MAAGLSRYSSRSGGMTITLSLKRVNPRMFCRRVTQRLELRNSDASWLPSNH